MLLARKSVNSGLLFDLDKLQKEIIDLTAQSEQENFWNNRANALEVIAKLNHAKEIVETYTGLLNSHKDLEELIEFDDDSFLEQIESSFDDLKKKTKEFELQILFTGEFDDLNAILEIHPGAGGTEAQDWADMLYRMYVLYAEQHRFKMQLISFEPGEEAGVKSVTLQISGKHAYVLLKVNVKCFNFASHKDFLSHFVAVCESVICCSERSPRWRILPKRKKIPKRSPTPIFKRRNRPQRRA